MSTELIKKNGDHSVPKNDDAPRSWASAAVDILEGADEFLVYADVPGVKQENINIEYADGELRVHAERAVENDTWASQYRRAFTVGREIDVDRISAELEHGVLRVHLPKMASAKPRQISIRAG